MEASAQRAVTLELHTGEVLRGTLVRTVGERYFVRVEDRSLELHDHEVAQLTYVEGPPTSAPDEDPGDEAPAPADASPLRIEAVDLARRAAEAAAEAAADAGDGPPEGAGAAAAPSPTPAPAAGLSAALAAELFARPSPETPAVPALPGARASLTYVLLDGAALPDGALPWFLKALTPPPLCLWPGKLSREQAATAPYLAALEPGAKATERLLGRGWGAHWGVFFRSPAAPEQLVAHLRSFLRVAHPAGRSLLFRFYDPRVLRAYLPTLDAHEVATLFGGAWCRRAGKGEDLTCPVCDAELRPLLARCDGCGLTFGGASPSAPFLVDEVLLEGEDPGTLLRARPWPDVPDEERPLPMRRFQRGEKLLTVRPEQLAALAAEANRRRLEDWAVGHVRRAFPERCAALSPPEVRARVRAGQARAAGYGLRETEHVVRFLDVAFAWHPDFDAHRDGPWYDLLRDDTLSADAKAEQMWKTLQELTWKVEGRRRRAASRRRKG